MFRAKICKSMNTSRHPGSFEIIRDFRLPPRCWWDLRSSGCYAASSSNPLPTFRDNVSVPSSRMKKSVKDCHSMLRNTPEERRSQIPIYCRDLDLRIAVLARDCCGTPVCVFAECKLSDLQCGLYLVLFPIIVLWWCRFDAMICWRFGEFIRLHLQNYVKYIYERSSQLILPFRRSIF
jgi:hypothetical protein